MSNKTQEVLAGSRAGRVVLHLACIAHGHFKRHFAGIWREVAHVQTRHAMAR